ncbi:hypothetical protein AC230_19135 [Streptomyces caatingaensis]|uniref:Uncharacterized protein n=1 Tax=Streptomyces caatingaensis TaxID=1678637 RepID=A0A0K9XBW6_9ACTN|nr:hypothetical protein AC230_19135 [Streptomyces caatingaensis]
MRVPDLQRAEVAEIEAGRGGGEFVPVVRSGVGDDLRRHVLEAADVGVVGGPCGAVLVRTALRARSASGARRL